jgi:hypothetical protein
MLVRIMNSVGLNSKNIVNNVRMFNDIDAMNKNLKLFSYDNIVFCG